VSGRGPAAVLTVRGGAGTGYSKTGTVSYGDSLTRLCISPYFYTHWFVHFSVSSTKLHPHYSTFLWALSMYVPINSKATK